MRRAKTTASQANTSPDKGFLILQNQRNKMFKKIVIVATCCSFLFLGGCKSEEEKEREKYLSKIRAKQLEMQADMNSPICKELQKEVDFYNSKEIDISGLTAKEARKKYRKEQYLKN